MKWNYYSATGEWLGVVEAGDDAAEALKAAQAQNPDAQSVDKRGEAPSHERP
jgi:hypothetical protein